MTIERVDAQDRDFAKRAGRDAVVGPGTPGRDRDRPVGIGDLVPSAIVGGSENPSMEERKANTEIGAINVPEEIGKRVELGFDRHERVEGILS